MTQVSEQEQELKQIENQLQQYAESDPDRVKAMGTS